MSQKGHPRPGFSKHLSSLELLTITLNPWERVTNVTGGGEKDPKKLWRNPSYKWKRNLLSLPSLQKCSFFTLCNDTASLDNKKKGILVEKSIHFRSFQHVFDKEQTCTWTIHLDISQSIWKMHKLCTSTKCIQNMYKLPWWTVKKKHL